MDFFTHSVSNNINLNSTVTLTPLSFDSGGPMTSLNLDSVVIWHHGLWTQKWQWQYLLQNVLVIWSQMRKFPIVTHHEPIVHFWDKSRATINFLYRVTYSRKPLGRGSGQCLDTTTWQLRDTRSTCGRTTEPIRDMYTYIHTRVHMYIILGKPPPPPQLMPC
jgi:hypothetical protein